MGRINIKRQQKNTLETLFEEDLSENFTHLKISSTCRVLLYQELSRDSYNRVWCNVFNWKKLTFSLNFAWQTANLGPSAVLFTFLASQSEKNRVNIECELHFLDVRVTNVSTVSNQSPWRLLTPPSLPSPWCSHTTEGLLTESFKEGLMTRWHCCHDVDPSGSPTFTPERW